MSSSKRIYFEPELFRFFTALKRNNRREWFHKHKPDYEKFVKMPLLQFIADLKEPMRSISPAFKVEARPVGGSMFRIYRDLRFSPDQKPYKTHAAAHFTHRMSSEKVHAPGFYLHLEPGDCFAGGGIWHPNNVTLRRIRSEILDRSDAWGEVRACKFEIEGESLKKPLRGVDPSFEWMDDLRRKDFVAGLPLTQAQVCGRDFLDRFLHACETIEPLMKFLTRALGLPW